MQTFVYTGNRPIKINCSLYLLQNLIVYFYFTKFKKKLPLKWIFRVICWIIIILDWDYVFQGTYSTFQGECTVCSHTNGNRVLWRENLFFLNTVSCALFFDEVGKSRIFFWIFWKTKYKPSYKMYSLLVLY